MESKKKTYVRTGAGTPINQLKSERTDARLRKGELGRENPVQLLKAAPRKEGPPSASENHALSGKPALGIL